MTGRPIVRRKQSQFLNTFTRGTPPTSYSYRDPNQNPASPFGVGSSDGYSVYDGVGSPNKENTNANGNGNSNSNSNPSVAGSVRGKRDSSGAGPGSGSGSGSGQTRGEGQGIVISGPESLGALVEKRTASWWYLRRAHDGNELWFHTIQVTRGDIESHLESTLGQVKLQQRCKQLFILGLSLSPLFEMSPALDLLRTGNKILDEWEVWAEGGGGKGMKNLFRGQKVNRRTGSASDFGAVQDTGETALVFANLPFTPDYFQTVISLCEVIRQLYLKLGSLLGPNASTPNLSDVRSAARSPGPSGNSSPRASSFAINKGRNVSGMSGMSSHPGSGGVSLHGGGASLGGRAGWAMGTGEQVMKLDLKLKKILNMFAREMESIARKAVDEELASLLHGESRRSFGIGSSFAGGGTAIE